MSTGVKPYDSRLAEWRSVRRRVFLEAALVGLICWPIGAAILWMTGSYGGVHLTYGQWIQISLPVIAILMIPVMNMGAYPKPHPDDVLTDRIIEQSQKP